MKHLALFILLLVISMSANAQTGLYKRFASHPGVKAYCVEKFPLAEADTACVTLLEAEDSATYTALRKDLNSLPWTPTKKRLEPTLKMPFTTQNLPKNAALKSFEAFTIDGLKDDQGYYFICCPSDRMVFLAFLLRNESEYARVIRHVLITEF